MGEVCFAHAPQADEPARESRRLTHRELESLGYRMTPLESMRVRVDTSLAEADHLGSTFLYFAQLVSSTLPTVPPGFKVQGSIRMLVKTVCPPAVDSDRWTAENAEISPGNS
jgi:hypothetical protein